MPRSEGIYICEDKSIKKDMRIELDYWTAWFVRSFLNYWIIEFDTPFLGFIDDLFGFEVIDEKSTHICDSEKIMKINLDDWNRENQGLWKCFIT